MSNLGDDEFHEAFGYFCHPAHEIRANGIIKIMCWANSSKPEKMKWMAHYPPLMKKCFEYLYDSAPFKKINSLRLLIHIVNNGEMEAVAEFPRMLNTLNDLSANDTGSVKGDAKYLFDKIRENVKLDIRIAPPEIEGPAAQPKDTGGHNVVYMIHAYAAGEMGRPAPLAALETAEQGFKKFAAKVWSLIPEFNPSMRGQGYSPLEFLAALKGILAYVARPEIDNPEIQNLRTRENLSLLTDYTKAKIASGSIASAMAMQIDPAIPLPNFMRNVTVGHFPVPGKRNFDEKEKIVLTTLIDRGDRPANFWDSPQSPIGAFLVRSLGVEATKKIAVIADEYLTSATPDYAGFIQTLHREYPAMIDTIYAVMMRAHEDIKADADNISQRSCACTLGLRNQLNRLIA